MKKLLLILVILSTLLYITACGDNKVDDIPEFESAQLDGWQSYSIIYPDGADLTLSNAFSSLANAIKEKTGVSLKMESDFVIPSEPVPTDTLEVLVGITNRQESVNALKSIRSEDFVITFENNRLVITGGSSSATARAVEFYISYMLDGSGLVFPAEAVIVRSEYPLDTLTIGGVDISEFVIVRGSEMSATDKSLCALLQRKISLLCGVNVPMVSAKEPEQEYEILFGKTGREESSFDIPAGTAASRQTDTKLAFYANGENGSGAMIKHLVGILDSITATKSYDLKIEAFEGEPYTLPHLTATNVLAVLTDNTGAYDPDFRNAENVYDRFVHSVSQLPDEITVLDPFEIEDFIMLSPIELYIAPDGNDNNAGTIDAPLATLAAATKRLNGKEGGVIWVRGGTYNTADASAISTAKGTTTSPIFIKAYGDETPVFTLGKSLSSSVFKPLDPNDEVGARIPDDAQANVVYVNLFELGWTSDDIGAITEKSSPSLCINDTAGEIARFPNSNEDLLYFNRVNETGSVELRDNSKLYANWIKRVKNWDAWKKAGGTDKSTYVFDRSLYTNLASAIEDAKKLDKASDTLYTDDYGNMNLDLGWEIKLVDITPLSWVNTGDIWFYGNTYSGYRFVTSNIASFEKSTMSMISKHGVPHGAMESSNSPTGYNNYYLFNIIEALDYEGEWYVDKTTGNLYIYKTADFDGATITYSSRSSDIIYLTGCSNVIFDGLTVELGGGKGMHISNSDNVVIQRCTFSKTEGSAIYIDTSSDCAIIYNEIFDTGATMIDTATRDSELSALNPTRHVIQNNYCHDPRYSQKLGISFSGIQSVASHNYLVDCGIFLDTTAECIVEYNDVKGGSPDILDGGLIYLGMYYNVANHVRYNYLHDWNAPNAGVYFDDLSCFNYAYGNIIDCTDADIKTTDHVRMLYSSSGHYNVFFGNLLVGRAPDAITESTNYFEDKVSFDGFSAEYVANLNKYSDTFFRHFPEIKAYHALMSQHVAERSESGYVRNELEIYVRSPAGNVIMNNLVVGTDEPINQTILKKTNSVTGKPMTSTDLIKNNYHSSDASLVLTDYENGDYTVLPNMLNQVKSQIPEFSQLSYDKAGLTYER